MKKAIILKSAEQVLGGGCYCRHNSAVFHRSAVEALEPRTLLAGDGLWASYYNDLDFEGTSIQRTDPEINFSWGTHSPDDAIGANTFSVRWTGQIEAPATGTYRFYARTDDGVRLWVDGKLLINYWHWQALRERSGQITLAAGRHDITMEYFENTGAAVAQLRWSGPGFSKQLVPQESLYSMNAPTPLLLTAKPAANVPKVLLQWTDPSKVQNGYIVERSPDGTNYTAVATLPANTTAYTDVRGLAAGTTYWYRVRADGTLATISDAVQARTADFHVYDATLYLSKPDLAAYGIENTYLASERYFFDSWTEDLAVRRNAEPSEAATRAVAQRAVAAGREILIVDIEGWPTDIRRVTPEEVQASMDRYSKVIAWLRDEAPGLKIGLFSVVPNRSDARPDLYTQQQMDAWAAANAFLAPLAAQVDYLYPNLYTYSENPAVWQRSAQLIIEQAQQYGKPIYPFIWMEYFPNTSSETVLPPDFWRMQLDTLRQSVDGLVMWGGWRQPWDSTSPWWAQTADFVSA